MTWQLWRCLSTGSSAASTILEEIITEMRGADLIVFELILNCDDCNSMRI